MRYFQSVFQIVRQSLQPPEHFSSEAQKIANYPHKRPTTATPIKPMWSKRAKLLFSCVKALFTLPPQEKQIKQLTLGLFFIQHTYQNCIRFHHFHQKTTVVAVLVFNVLFCVLFYSPGKRSLHAVCLELSSRTCWCFVLSAVDFLCFEMNNRNKRKIYIEIC